MDAFCFDFVYTLDPSYERNTSVPADRLARGAGQPAAVSSDINDDDAGYACDNGASRLRCAGRQWRVWKLHWQV